MKRFKLHISIAVLLLFHAIGIGGVLIGDSEQFLKLTPVNLLLTLGIIGWNHADWKRWWIFVFSFVLGFFIEVIGVNTGWPFGEYSYGPVLGLQLFSTPLMIGVNWLMLLYATNAISKTIQVNFLIRIAIAAMLMTVLDLFIKPVAIQLNFWTWSIGDIPMSNYISWFVISALISLPWQRTDIQLNRNVGYAVFSVQLGFFLVLNLF